MIQTPFSGRNLLQVIPYVFGKILNNARVGTYCVIVQQAFVANTDTVIAHNLGRVPQGYYTGRCSVPCGLFDASTGTAAWTATSITIRASATSVLDVWLY